MIDSPNTPPVDWSLTTYEGARREQVRRWSRLSLVQVIEALEEMEQLAIRFGTLPDPASTPRAR